MPSNRRAAIRLFVATSLTSVGLVFLLGTNANAAPITLDELDATASPVGGGQFPAVDVNGVLGPPGADIFFGPAQIDLWTTSGIPGANTGTLDPATGSFALNWGASATFDVFDAFGLVQIGTGEILAVLPETGTFDPVTGLGTSSTAGFVTGDFILDGLVTTVGIININIFALAPDGAGGFDGVFLAGTGPELMIQLPLEMGGGTLEAELEGTFHLTAVPEPATLSLLAVGLGALAAKRRQRPRRRTSQPMRCSADTAADNY